MKILVFDVETTGLPKKRRAALDDFDNWPYIVQLSWVVYDVIEGGIESINDQSFNAFITVCHCEIY